MMDEESRLDVETKMESEVKREPEVKSEAEVKTEMDSQENSERKVAHSLAVLVLAPSIIEARERIRDGVEWELARHYDVKVEHDQLYNIDGRLRFMIYCYNKMEENESRNMVESEGKGLGIQEMRELVKGLTVKGGKVGYISNDLGGNFRLNITPTSKMTSKEVVAQIITNETVQKHTENALGAPFETLIVRTEKRGADRDEREIPTTVLTLCHPIVGYHLMLFSVRGVIRQHVSLHSENLEPLPLSLVPAYDNPQSSDFDFIKRQLPGVGLHLQILQYRRDAGRNLGERRVMEHANALIDACRKWKREGDQFDSYGPVGVSVYIVHEDYSTDIQVRSLIHGAAKRFRDFMQHPDSAELRRVPPVGHHRRDYGSATLIPQIFTGREFFERFGRLRKIARNRANSLRRERERRYDPTFTAPAYVAPIYNGTYSGARGGIRGRQERSMVRGGGGDAYEYGGASDPGHYNGFNDRSMKRSRSDYDDDRNSYVPKRSRIDMALRSS